MLKLPLLSLIIFYTVVRLEKLYQLVRARHSFDKVSKVIHFGAHRDMASSVDENVPILFVLVCSRQFMSSSFSSKKQSSVLSFFTLTD